jgi:hypothetical protein
MNAEDTERKEKICGDGVGGDSVELRRGWRVATIPPLRGPARTNRAEEKAGPLRWDDNRSENAGRLRAGEQIRKG